MSRIAKAKSTSFRCIDGPYQGRDIFLTTESTAHFHVDNWRGHYTKVSHNTVKWKPA